MARDKKFPSVEQARRAYQRRLIAGAAVVLAGWALGLGAVFAMIVIGLVR